MKKLIMLFIGAICSWLVHASDYSTFKVTVAGKGEPLVLLPASVCYGKIR